MSALAEVESSKLAEERCAEEHLQRILESRFFARADTMRRLLLYLWANRGQSISEYAIATDGLGRSENFDTGSDASVRVQMSRLRRKLKEFYEENPHEAELLQIPTGGHNLIIVPKEVLPDTETTGTKESEERAAAVKELRWRNALLIATLGALAIAVVGVGVLWQRLQATMQARQGALPNAFWQEFLAGDAPVKIILPTPVFFGFDDKPWLRLRSTQVNDFSEKDSSPDFRVLMDRLGESGTSKLDQSYTVTSDTLAAIDMARYLDLVGQAKRVSFGVTRDSPHKILEEASVVIIGTHATLSPFRDQVGTMNFLLGPAESWVSNAHPETGEQARYPVIEEGGSRRIEPSVLAVLPGQSKGLRLLVLESRHTGALVSMIASNEGVNDLEKLRRAHGNPDYFEVVVLSECEDNNVLRSWPVALHEYHVTPKSN